MKKKYSNDISTIEDVRERKMVLKKQMEAQKEALLYNFHDINDHISTTRMVVDLVRSAVKNVNLTKVVVNALTGSIVKDRRRIKWMYWVMPIALAALPKVLPKVLPYIFKRITKLIG